MSGSERTMRSIAEIILRRAARPDRWLARGGETERSAVRSTNIGVLPAQPGARGASACRENDAGISYRSSRKCRVSIPKLHKFQQRAAFQYVRRGVAGALDDVTKPAGFDVDTVSARGELGLADAGRERQRAVDGTDHVSHADPRGWQSEAVATGRSAATFHQSIVAQLDQDRFEKLARDHRSPGDLGGMGPAIRPLLLGQH